MKLTRLFGIIFCFSCSGLLKIQKPIEQKFKNAHISDNNFDTAWSRVVAWYANRNVIIDKLDKESGLITTKYEISVGTDFLDCGIIEPRGHAKINNSDRSIYLNTMLTKVNESQTKDRVNVFGQIIVQGIDYGWGEKRLDYSGKCYTTGQIERPIFKAVDATIELKFKEIETKDNLKDVI